MTTLSPETGAILIAVGILVIFAALAWLFERFDRRHAEHYEQRAQQDAERLIADANADLFQHPRVRAVSHQTNKQE